MALRKFLGGIVLLAAAGAGAFYFITAPQRLPAQTWASAGEPDLANGERLFNAGGCASCHAAPGAADADRLVLAGGLALKSPFGTFHAPNISPDETAGIGGWTLAEFGDAMKRGTGRRGEHLYPAFPYASYARMTVKDIGDLYGYLKTLPKSASVPPGHDLPFPFNMRLLLGGWKFLYLNEAPRVVLADANETVKHGQYLVEGPGHCGECAGRAEDGRMVCRRAEPGGRRPHSGHHARRGQVRRLERGGYRRLSRNRLHAGLRQRRRGDGRHAEEHGAPAEGGPRGDRGVSQGGAGAVM